MTNDPVVHVIDDDDAARDALRFLLRSANFSVHAYESAVAFLDAIPAIEAGCIITDVSMPDISGLDLLRRLKCREIGWPVIVITGHADVPVAIRAIKSGAVDFIEKPYDGGILLEAVNLALSGQTNVVRVAQRTEVQLKLAALTRLERELLQTLVDGDLNNTTTHGTGSNTRSFDLHRANVMAKMGATSLSHLVRMMLLVGP